MHISAEWYETVLGFQFVKEFAVLPGEEGTPRILLLHPASGFLIGLCSPRDRSGDEFTPLRTGLDHLALEVRDAEDLDRWISHLDSLGVAHSPIRDLGHSRFISLEDPDGIQFEVWLTLTPHTPRPRR